MPYLFSTGNGVMLSSVKKVNWGVSGVDAGTSTNRYSTGKGLANLVTSFPYVSFS